MEENLEKHINTKYEYLNAPCLIEDFRKTYLTSLNIFLNDDKFKAKTDSLPILKSSAITKYEKLISKEEAELIKKRKLNLKNKNKKLQPLELDNEYYNTDNNFNKRRLTSKTTPNINFKKKIKAKKGIQVRYIIIDHELVEISLKAIEENSEINNKLTDPFNAYFHEQNPKVKKKALEQIIYNIIPNKKNNNNFNINKDNNNNYDDEDDFYNNNTIKVLYDEDEDKKIFNNDLEILEKKYKN